MKISNISPIKSSTDYNHTPSFRAQIPNDSFDSFESSTQSRNSGFLNRIISRVNSFFKPETPTEQSDIEKSEIEQFIDSPDYDKEIKAATQGKYQKEFLEILSRKNIEPRFREELIESGITKQELLEGLKKLSVSTFKAALNKPSQYINYTQDPQYQMFFIDTYEKLQNKSKEEQDRAYMKDFFKTNLTKMVKALRYIDTDALNQMMDKRSTGFLVMLRGVDSINEENGELLKTLISHTQEGNARQKIKLCQLVEIFQNNDFDMDILRNLSETGEIDTEALNSIFKNAIKEKANLGDDFNSDNLSFNEEYFHLLFSRHPLLNNGNPSYGTEALDAVIQGSAQGDFIDFISDTNNRYGKVNQNTKTAFENEGFDYDEWLRPETKEETFELNNEKMTLRLWKRNPKEDIFIGNKTRCCTAIATGSNSLAMPLFLLNSAFNVIELCDKKGNTKGMARIYMTKVNEKSALVIDSIELADIKDLNDDEKEKIANHIFDYASKYASKITGSDTPVYYIYEDSHIPLDEQKCHRIKMKFIGDVSSSTIYSNSGSSFRWSDIRGEKWTSLYKYN